ADLAVAADRVADRWPCAAAHAATARGRLAFRRIPGWCRMSRSSHEPTAAVKPATRGRGDTPPPTPPHELPRDAQVEHRFTHEGRSWLARLSGKGACGTGSYGLALVE